jgi:hypothetical protein
MYIYFLEMSFHVAVYKTPNQGLGNENAEQF